DALDIDVRSERRRPDLRLQVDEIHNIRTAQDEAVILVATERQSIDFSAPSYLHRAGEIVLDEKSIVAGSAVEGVARIDRSRVRNRVDGDRTPPTLDGIEQVIAVAAAQSISAKAVSDVVGALHRTAEQTVLSVPTVERIVALLAEEGIFAAIKTILYKLLAPI